MAPLQNATSWLDEVAEGWQTAMRRLIVEEQNTARIPTTSWGAEEAAVAPLAAAGGSRTWPDLHMRRKRKQLGPGESSTSASKWSE